MLATVGVRDLEVFCVIGVRPHEREREQVITLDLAIDYDVGDAIATDTVDDVVDYSAVADMVREHLRDRSYGLLESAAAGIVALIAGAYPRVARIVVEIRKPQALEGTATGYIRLDTNST